MTVRMVLIWNRVLFFSSFLFCKVDLLNESPIEPVSLQIGLRGILDNIFKKPPKEPEAYMTTVEIIRKRGYPAEAHTVQTEDGYILELHRIPYGRSGPSANREPVFLQHGLFFQSVDWIINFGNQSLGYMLADVGFDVWLGNFRGNTNSRKHVTLNPDTDKDKFWDFSFQEHGNFDLPASIDYILNFTQFGQLSYVGHSMGTTAFFVLMCNRTEYNAKIKTMVGLAPVFMNSAIPNNIYKTFSDPGNYDEFLGQTDSVKSFQNLVCNNPLPLLCEFLIHLAAGYRPDPAQLNRTRIPVYTSYFPAGTSTKTIDHYLQYELKTNGVLRAYDYGPDKNIQVYGQPVPPPYDTSKVTVPVALFWGLNDFLATEANVALLAQVLPNVALHYKVENPLWHHFDFMWAIEAERYQNTQAADFLQSF